MKNHIRRNFSRAACTYNEFGKTQQKIADDFAHKLLKLKAPSSILEIGCGTGFLSHYLADYACPIVVSDLSSEMVEKLNIPKALPVVYDGEYFPFKQSFDWIVSSLAFQWFQHPATTLSMLKQHSQTLAFTTLGNNNFLEWKTFCALNHIENRTPPMLSMADLKAILGRDISIEETYYSEYHPNWLSFWNSIYKIGAQTSFQPKVKSIPKSLFLQEPITCTYHVLTVIAQ
ncbi:MAG: methyltransferase domain-containing protein [Candidatus Paracaedibacteraceae bacterium]|nr:methyltransferase domain-containing protein [Candidatus Paracaedibacteraceae bacterium]